PLSPEEAALLGDGEIEFARGAELLAIRADLSGMPVEDLPPVAGRYRREGDLLVFESAFPLASGITYIAEFRPGSSHAESLELTVPARVREPSTVVEEIYPSASVLPENLLKLYIHFSAPMSRGEAWERLSLVHTSGRVVDLPFLEIDEELWDPRGVRLTVLFDPGRIKRGVLPHEELGPALVDGEEYVLEIDPGWLDAEGTPLAEGMRKLFRVGPIDVTQPDPSKWTLDLPRAGTRDPLVVHLDEALDHGLLHSAVGVAGPSGEGLRGEVRVTDHETTWHFKPADSWGDAEYSLVVATTLEDLAGNSVGRPFEVDIVETVGRRIEVDSVRIPFRPLVPLSGAR
ncbi:MAG TPA: hypothetical protein VK116_00865, partial [Planctomycetota bacterium]|nr:hypothetical protein [Planctomycetota bacterium]